MRRSRFPRVLLTFVLAWQAFGLDARAQGHALAPHPVGEDPLFAPHARAHALTLAEAVARATRMHPAIEASSLGVAQAQAATREAWAGWKPTFSLSGGIQPHVNVPGPQLQLNAVQPLFDGNRTLLAVRQAELSEADAGLARVAVRRRIAYETALSYFAVLQAERLLEATRLNIEQAREQLALAELRAKGQVGTRLEVLQAAGAIATAQDGYLQAAYQARQARETLENHLGHSLGETSLVGTSALKHVSFGPEQVARALEARPEVAQAHVAREAQEVMAVQRARQTWPTLSAVGDVSLAEARQSVRASLTWPFLDAGRTRAQVDHARLGAARAEATLNATRRAAALEIRLASETLLFSEERLKVAQQGLQAAIEGLKLAKVRFAGGVGTGLEVINALTTLSHAQSAYVQGKFAVKTSQLRLAQALGLDVEEILP